jgi:hypothetical protein
VLAEGLDRISCDEEDAAAVCERLRFGGVNIFAPAGGSISKLSLSPRVIREFAAAKRPHEHDAWREYRGDSSSQ